MPSRNSVGKPRNDGKRPYMSDAAYIAYMKFLRIPADQRAEFFEALRRQGYVVTRETS